MNRSVIFTISGYKGVPLTIRMFSPYYKKVRTGNLAQLFFERASKVASNTTGLNIPTVMPKFMQLGERYIVFKNNTMKKYIYPDGYIKPSSAYNSTTSPHIKHNFSDW